jgi:threonine dehydratase
MLPAPAFDIDDSRIDECVRLVRKYGLLETRVVESPALSDVLGRDVFLKCENEQITGAFKVRGALCRVAALRGEERHRGVVASSAGNHGLGIAWACRVLGVPGLVVVPETVARVKLSHLQDMLIKIQLHGSCYDEAEPYAMELAKEAGATFVSPFDDPWIMAGNGGTVGREIRAQLPDCSAVVSPVGGGGLATGLAVGVKPVPVVGVNSAASPAMARSITDRRVYHKWDAPPTLAEGLAGGVSDNSAALCARHLHGVEVIKEQSIEEAIRLIVRSHSMIIEGSAAVAVAAVLERKELPGEGPVCVVLTGRNIDKEKLRAVLRDSAGAGAGAASGRGEGEGGGAGRGVPSRRRPISKA